MPEKQARGAVGVSAALLAAGALGAALGHVAGWPIVGLAGRWAALAALCLFAWRRRSLTAWVLVAMVLGAEVGHDLPQVGAAMRVVSLIFIRLVKSLIAPLLFATLVVGIAGHSSLRQVGRMGVKALVYFEVVTTLALLVGLAAINISRAGVGVTPPAEILASDVPGRSQTVSEILLDAFPENLARAVAEGHVLQIVVWSVLFAVAVALLPEPRRRVMLSFCESLSEAMFKLTKLVMYLAPLAVGAAIAATVSHMGLGVLVNLLHLLATAYLALAAFLLLVLLPIALIARVPLRRFVSAVAEPVSIAFATTSSEAALPAAMKRMEELGVPRQTVAFVMPTGYSFNLDGSTLYLALASIFVAQAAGKHLTLGEQVTLVLTLMIASKGIAGVPRATLVILFGAAGTLGLPEWPILVLLGIDELMDMARTSVNVIGNCLATLVIARWEGEYPPKEAAGPETAAP